MAWLMFRKSLIKDSANVDYDLYNGTSASADDTVVSDASDFIVDIREYDVPYHVRLAIDKGKRYRTILLSTG